MKISDLIRELQNVLGAHGDIEVACWDLVAGDPDAVLVTESQLNVEQVAETAAYRPQGVKEQIYLMIGG